MRQTSDRSLPKNQYSTQRKLMYFMNAHNSFLSCHKVPESDFQRQCQYQEPFESFWLKSLYKT